MSKPSSWHAAFARLLLVSSGLVGCVGTAKATRFYQGPERPRNEVARLSGPVARIDGNSVPTGGGTFDLLPGCHVVQIGGRIGDLSPTPVSGWSATLPPLVYAFRMQPGASYSISFEPEASLGRRSVGFGDIVAAERTAQGKLRVVPPARSREDVMACLQPTPS